MLNPANRRMITFSLHQQHHHRRRQVNHVITFFFVLPLDPKKDSVRLKRVRRSFFQWTLLYLFYLDIVNVQTKLADCSIHSKWSSSLVITTIFYDIVFLTLHELLLPVHIYCDNWGFDFSLRFRSVSDRAFQPHTNSTRNPSQMRAFYCKKMENPSICFGWSLYHVT